LNQSTPLVASCSIKTPIACNGGNGVITVSASGGTPPFSGTGDFTKAAGTFTFTVTDANGCTATTTCTLNQPTPLVASCSIKPPIACNGGNVVITVSASGGTPPFSGTGDFTKAAETFTFTVTDANSLHDALPISLNQSTPLVASCSIKTPIACNGGNGVI